MKTIKIILGSVRQEKAGEKVAKWVLENAYTYYGNIEFEYIDLSDMNLPFMDEPISPMASNNYQHEHTRIWSKVIEEGDGFIFITPEYNHGYPPVLKNAIDYLFEEWTNKPVGFIGYGGNGAKDSIRQMEEVLHFMKMRPLEYKVTINQVWGAFRENGKINSENVQGDILELFKQLDVFVSS